jgi:hypothetical protein
MDKKINGDIIQPELQRRATEHGVILDFTSDVCIRMIGDGSLAMILTLPREICEKIIALLKDGAEVLPRDRIMVNLDNGVGVLSMMPTPSGKSTVPVIWSIRLDAGVVVPVPPGLSHELMQAMVQTSGEQMLKLVNPYIGIINNGIVEKMEVVRVPDVKH